MTESSLAPIALFVYRRPARVQRVLESLNRNALAKDSAIYIFSDAAKSPDIEAEVEAVRLHVRSLTGFREIHVIERHHNYGLARSIIEGVTNLCSSHGRVIVVEDDLAVSPHFLEFMNHGLDRYRSEPRVMQISGHTFPFGIDCAEDAFFLPLTTSWGWATWDRAWRLFDPAAAGYEQLRNNKAEQRKFDFDGSYPYFAMLERQFRGEVDSWAVRWHLSVFMNDGLVLYPKKNLVLHEGWDETATHAKRRPETYLTEIEPTFRASAFPQVELDRQHYRDAANYLRKFSGADRARLLPRIRAKITRILRGTGIH